MEDRTDLRELLNHINPALLNYEEWTEVGMALKFEGYSCDVWDDWSRRDFGRYHTGECAKKWRSFRRDEGVTGGTIVHMAMEAGWMPPQREAGRVLDLDGELDYVEGAIVGEGWVEHRDIDEPSSWEPAKELIRYET